VSVVVGGIVPSKLSLGGTLALPHNLATSAFGHRNRSVTNRRRPNAIRRNHITKLAHRGMIETVF